MNTTRLLALYSIQCISNLNKIQTHHSTAGWECDSFHTEKSDIQTQNEESDIRTQLCSVVYIYTHTYNY